MRLFKYLKEWKTIRDYAGRGILVSPEAKHFVIWYYLVDPVEKGLIWTIHTGETFLNNKKLGKVSAGKRITHKQVLAKFYKKLGFGELMSGNLRDDVENILEMNPRGRLLGFENYVYDFYMSGMNVDKTEYERRVNNALKACTKYIPDDYMER